MKRIVAVGLCAVLAACEAGSQSQASVSQQQDNHFTNGKTGEIYVSAAGTSLRLTAQDKLVFQDFAQPLETDICIFVDPTKKYQAFLGIGGAITDASAETFAKLSPSKQQEFLEAYYDDAKGIGYTLARTTIHSSDFSSGSYTYVTDNDPALKSFSIAPDLKYRVPMLKRILAQTGKDMVVYASPWSPPAWMKDNKNMLRGGKLLPEYRQTWADYYVKYVNAYEKEGIPIWGLSVQNEPMAVQRWESCIFTATEERDFIKQYLGPTLKRNGLGNRKLIAWDHNRDLIYQRASTILDDPEAAKYVWGIGFHWYETWTKSDMQFENVKRVYETYPSTNLLFTEGCIEKFEFSRLDDWALGQKYGYSMINDFNSGTVGWTDWNILLDEKGGPNHVGNFCFAPVIADTRNDKLHYTSSYYYIGHFSKFIKPGANRVGCSSNRDKLLATSFLNKDGKLVVVVMNSSNETLPYYLWLDGKAAKTTSLPNSISTIVIR